MGSLIVLALSGLPGTGKSTLAKALAAQFDCPVLNKDRVRQALFGDRFTAYSRAQDDHCCEILYASAAWLARQRDHLCAVIDGRTFLGEGQAERLVICSREQAFDVKFVLCTAPRAEALRRIEADRLLGVHPAQNRTVSLFEELERDARPLAYPHCVVDTCALSLEEQVQRVRQWTGL